VRAGGGDERGKDEENEEAPAHPGLYRAGLHRALIRPVELEITPEPSPEERAVVERSLTRLVQEDIPAGRGAWWRAGIEENVSPEEEPA
jgi:hypothetical protein